MIRLPGAALRARRTESVARICVTAAGFFVVAAMAALITFLAIEGSKLFTVDHVSVFEFLFSPKFNPDAAAPGALAFIVGSIAITLFAIVVGGPFGIAVGIFLAELAPKRVAAVFKPAIEVLVGVPSIVYGWLGLTLLVPLIRSVTKSSGFGLLAAGIVLSIMILPTVISLSEDALLTVPGALREGALALGSTRWQAIARVVLPAASSGLSVAVILGMARAIGETLAVQMVIGNANRIPAGLLTPTAALPTEIVIDMGEASQGSLLQHALFTMALLLLLIAMTLIVITKAALRRRTAPS